MNNSNHKKGKKKGVDLQFTQKSNNFKGIKAISYKLSMKNWIEKMENLSDGYSILNTTLK
jgi:hypothetical protein